MFHLQCAVWAFLVLSATAQGQDYISAEASAFNLTEEFILDLYETYKEAYTANQEEGARRQLRRDDREYDVHIQKLKEVNGLKSHNLILRENTANGPLVYINNPLESQIPHAYLSLREFRQALMVRALRSRDKTAKGKLSHVYVENHAGLRTNTENKQESLRRKKVLGGGNAKFFNERQRSQKYRHYSSSHTNLPRKYKRGKNGQYHLIEKEDDRPKHGNNHYQNSYHQQHQSNHKQSNHQQSNHNKPMDKQPDEQHEAQSVNEEFNTNIPNEHVDNIQNVEIHVSSDDSHITQKEAIQNVPNVDNQIIQNAENQDTEQQDNKSDALAISILRDSNASAETINQSAEGLIIPAYTDYVTLGIQGTKTMPSPNILREGFNVNERLDISTTTIANISNHVSENQSNKTTTVPSTNPIVNYRSNSNNTHVNELVKVSEFNHSETTVQYAITQTDTTNKFSITKVNKLEMKLKEMIFENKSATVPNKLETRVDTTPKLTAEKNSTDVKGEDKIHINDETTVTDEETTSADTTEEDTTTDMSTETTTETTTEATTEATTTETSTETETETTISSVTTVEDTTTRQLPIWMRTRFTHTKRLTTPTTTRRTLGRPLVFMNSR